MNEQSPSLIIGGHVSCDFHFPNGHVALDGNDYVITTGARAHRITSLRQVPSLVGKGAADVSDDLTATADGFVYGGGGYNSAVAAQEIYPESELLYLDSADFDPHLRSDMVKQVPDRVAPGVRRC
jgi:hypothetical protein